MRRRPVQEVRIFEIQDRRDRPEARRPWVVRWRIDGDDKSKAFRTKPEATRYRSRLIVAHQDGEWFDRRTGEPESWRPAAADQPVYEWARQWLAEEWPDLAPRSRASAVYALSRFLPLVADPKATAAPAGLRRHLQQTLPPGSPLATNDSERWLSRWGLTIGELNRELLADVERRLRIGDSGQPLAASTAGRFRKVARSCVGRAAELKNLPDPWPPSPKGRGRRKARRQRRAVDVRLLPDPMSMLRIIEAMASHQPGSRIYQTMTAVTYYAGLRPSEVLYLRPQALELPATGWGTIHVVEADDGYDQAAEPKTGSRDVPIEPDLVIILRRWVEQHRLARAELLFRTRTGKRPTMSNWGRSLKRACRKVGHRMLTPYDARHACATSWLRAGVPLGTAACRLGHSVETLVSTYVGALEGDDVVANDRIVVARDAARSQLAQGVTSVLAVCWTLPRPSHARPTDKG